MKLGTLMYQAGLILVTLLSLFAADTSLWREDDCRRSLREAKDVPRQPKEKPRLSGHWTSSRCETRPGPEFVLRKYSFRRHQFQAQIFYYADEYCSKVTHYVSAKGSVKLERSSWRTPGAYESKYSLSQVSVIPYTAAKAKTFQTILHRFCKASKKLSVSPFSKFKIYRFTRYKRGEKSNSIANDFDCTKIFNFTMNELQLVRIEKRYAQEYQRRNTANRKSHIETELLLGDISTNIKYRRQYRPTHYQMPLKKDKTPNCDVCQVLANSSRLRPPVLPRRYVTDVGLNGNWVSQRCETRPNGQYVTRFLTFPAGGWSWKGVYEFFKDPLCKEPYFRLDVKGTYVKESRSDVIPSAYNYVFRTMRIKVTPQDYQMVLYLNNYDGSKCGKPHAWKIGVSQDVTGTKGCMTLGITLPNIEHELIKTELDNRNSYLHVGQRPSDFASMADVKHRPTSFQSALVKCGKKNNVFVPVYKDTSVMYNVVAAYASNPGSSIRYSATCWTSVIVVLTLILLR